MEKLQYRALKYIFNDSVTDYEQLVKKANTTTLFLSRIKKFAFETYKITHDSSPAFMKEFIFLKPSHYDLRNTYCSLPHTNTVVNGLHSFSFYASHVYNALPNPYKTVISNSHFKHHIKSWEGPKCSCDRCNMF